MAVSTSTAMSSSGAPASSTTAAPSISYLTVTVKPLTTTFTPPASCGEMHLTQLSSPGYRIWLNEPLPVPGSRFGDCYPPGFIDGYTSDRRLREFRRPFLLSTGLPRGLEHGADLDKWLYRLLRLVSEFLVVKMSKCIVKYIHAWCKRKEPKTVEDDIMFEQVEHHVVRSNHSDSGFQLAPPTITVDANRPAYGGTCYSTFQADQTVNVTQYDSTSITATSIFIAKATDQAFAHPIDGFQVQLEPTTSSAASAASVSSTSIPAPSSHLSGGAIAGAVIGSLAGLVAILLAVLFLIRRYKRVKSTAAPFDGAGNGAGMFQQQEQVFWNKDQPGSPSTGYIQSPYYSTNGTFDSTGQGSPQENYRNAPMQSYELGVPQEPRELDSGWVGRELDAGGHGK
ncbi:hypothetical protein F4819DRAFT_259949 [Hypoxylon fuscum]|nr:hypothetical protein F4819DRAFT_259949 [Hypoxylon fuscum]